MFLVTWCLDVFPIFRSMHSLQILFLTEDFPVPQKELL
jgi:hypothetical protein